MTSKSDAELLKIIGNQKSFLLLAREAAILELDNRQFQSEEFQSLKSTFYSEKEIAEQAIKANEKTVEVPEHKPKNITTASYLIYGSIPLGFLKALFSKGVIGVSILESPLYLLVFVATIAVTALFGYFIGLGKNWARITLLIVFVLGLFGLPVTIPNEFRVAPLYGLATVGQYGLHMAAIILLFGRTTSAWIEKGKETTNPNNA